MGSSMGGNGTNITGDGGGISGGDLLWLFGVGLCLLGGTGRVTEGG
jgi:hypothetical protein